MAPRDTQRKFKHLATAMIGRELSSVFGRAFLECWRALDQALLSDNERMRLGAIRHRIGKGYVFDRPGEITVTREEDMAWLIERLERRD